MAQKGGLQNCDNLNSNAELVDYLSGMLKQKEHEMDIKSKQINEVLVSNHY
jgi:hypothetical protein